MFMLRHIPLHVSVRVFKLPTYTFVFENYLSTLTNNKINKSLPPWLFKSHYDV